MKNGDCKANKGEFLLVKDGMKKAKKTAYALFGHGSGCCKTNDGVSEETIVVRHLGR